MNVRLVFLANRPFLGLTVMSFIITTGLYSRLEMPCKDIQGFELGEFAYSDQDLVFKLSHLNKSKVDFDRMLNSIWMNHQINGHSRYQLLKPSRSRVLEGQYEFLLMLNPQRLTNRRSPVRYPEVSTQFDPDGFNFNKVDEAKEGIFSIRNSNEKAANDKRNLLLINASPFTLGSSLLAPRVEAKSPQVLDVYAIKTAVETILVSRDNNLKIGFNSLRAFASLNHQHWHLYYVTEPNFTLQLERIPVNILLGDCFTIDEPYYPAKGFAFEITRRDQIESAAESVAKLTDFLVNNEIGHNVLITRGTSFKSNGADDGENDAVRIFVWARKKTEFPAPKFIPRIFGTGVAELSGMVVVYDESKFNEITHDDVVHALKEQCDEQFDRVKRHILNGIVF